MPQSHLLSHSALFNPTWIGAYDWLRFGIAGRPFGQTPPAQPSPLPNEQLKTIGTALAPSSYRIRSANASSARAANKVNILCWWPEW